MFAAYIDEIIMACAGVWMAAIGFGYIELSVPPHQAWLGNLVKHFKWMGPLLLVIAAVLAVAAPT